MRNSGSIMLLFMGSFSLLSVHSQDHAVDTWKWLMSVEELLLII